MSPEGEYELASQDRGRKEGSVKKEAGFRSKIMCVLTEYRRSTHSAQSAGDWRRRGGPGEARTLLWVLEGLLVGK